MGRDEDKVGVRARALRILAVLVLVIAPAAAEAQRAPAHGAAYSRGGTDASAGEHLNGSVHAGGVANPSARVGTSRSGRAPARAIGVRPIAVAKWGALAGAAGAAAYGFIRNGEADDLYRDLEIACNADHATCALRTPGGAYADPTLEALYQEVVTRDRSSQRALIASQVGVAIGVVLFLLDLRPDERPADIPYEPRQLEITPVRGGGLAVRISLPLTI